MRTIKITLTKEETERFNLLKSRLGLAGRKLTPMQNGELIYLIRGFLSDIEIIKSVQICRPKNVEIKFGYNEYYTFANFYE